MRVRILVESIAGEFEVTKEVRETYSGLSREAQSALIADAVSAVERAAGIQ